MCSIGGSLPWVYRIKLFHTRLVLEFDSLPVELILCDPTTLAVKKKWNYLKLGCGTHQFMMIFHYTKEGNISSELGMVYMSWSSNCNTICSRAPNFNSPHVIRKITKLWNPCVKILRMRRPHLIQKWDLSMDRGGPLFPSKWLSGVQPPSQRNFPLYN